MREKKMRAKLEDFLQEVCEKTITNNQYPVLTSSKSGLFLQSDYFNKQVASKDNTGYKIIRRGQFTYRAMSDTGEFFPNMLECADVGIVSPAYPVFEIIKQDQIVPEYLNYYFKSNRFQNSISTFAQGSTRTSVKFGKLKKVSIELPEIKKQYQIIRTLDLLRTIINNRKKEVLELDELIRARFVEMFGDPIENPRGYYVATLQDLIEKGFITYHLDGNHGGDYPRSEEFVESGIPYISANCIVHGEIDFAKAKYLTPERAGKLRKGIAQNEDVLFAHNATVGPTVVLHTDEEKVILGTSLTAYRCNQEEIMPNYLKAYMMSNGFVRQYSSEMKQTTRNQVPITAQKKYQFLIPPIEEQKQFTVFVNQIDKSKLLSGCRLFHSWAPENRDKPKHVGVPRRKTKVLRGCRRQHAHLHH